MHSCFQLLSQGQAHIKFVPTSTYPLLKVHLKHIYFAHSFWFAQCLIAQMGNKGKEGETKSEVTFHNQDNWNDIELTETQSHNRGLNSASLLNCRTNNYKCPNLVIFM